MTMVMIMMMMMMMTYDDEIAKLRSPGSDDRGTQHYGKGPTIRHRIYQRHQLRSRRLQAPDAMDSWAQDLKSTNILAFIGF